MAEGRSNPAIAARLFLNAKTVESQVRRVFTKRGLLRHPTTTAAWLAVLAYFQGAPS